MFKYYHAETRKTIAEVEVLVCGGLTLVSCQKPTQMVSYSTSSRRLGEKIRWKSSMGPDKNMEVTHKLPPWGKQINLDKIKLRYCQLK